jgi:S-adenosylmethionine:tRNA ribosyltransferase-isomerase
VRVADFNYHLPEEQIAQEPLKDRAASRMLVLNRVEQSWADHHFREFPQWVNPGDCLVLNNSKVFPSRIYGNRASGSALIEAFLLRPVAGDPLTWTALVKPARRMPLGERVEFPRGLQAEVVAVGEFGERTLRFSGTDDIYKTLETIGHVPLPPYIHRQDSPEDRERYQTVFAKQTGSVAAPTAGLHFTPEILDACRAAGASIAEVTLHVGLGTFQPIHAENVEEVQLHSERVSMTPESMMTIRAARRRIAVGTTSVRAMESGVMDGETNIFIHPGFQFRFVDALLTNFHLPQSSLLMLVCAFAGKDFTLAAYEHAVREGYRFFSYGDCMLII